MVVTRGNSVYCAENIRSTTKDILIGPDSHLLLTIIFVGNCQDADIVSNALRALDTKIGRITRPMQSHSCPSPWYPANHNQVQVEEWVLEMQTQSLAIYGMPADHRLPNSQRTWLHGREKMAVSLCIVLFSALCALVAGEQPQPTLNVPQVLLPYFARGSVKANFSLKAFQGCYTWWVMRNPPSRLGRFFACAVVTVVNFSL